MFKHDIKGETIAHKSSGMMLYSVDLETADFGGLLLLDLGLQRAVTGTRKNNDS